MHTKMEMSGLAVSAVSAQVEAFIRVGRVLLIDDVDLMIAGIGFEQAVLQALRALDDGLDHVIAHDDDFDGAAFRKHVFDGSIGFLLIEPLAGNLAAHIAVRMLADAEHGVAAADFLVKADHRDAGFLRLLHRIYYGAS